MTISASSGAYYGASIRDFLASSPESIIGALAIHSGSVDASQRDAWVSQIDVLQRSLVGFEGHLFLEFDVPRVGSRIDAVLISGSAVIVIEFKVGERDFRLGARNQVWDYALDLKNFHLASHAAPIVPIVVATAAVDAEPRLLDPAEDGVFPPVMCSGNRLPDAIRLALRQTSGPSIDAAAWSRAPYHPTPTIIEAAQALYSHHSVEAIARQDAGARNLGVTSGRVEEIIEDARQHGRKVIVFVTGVPGAGKTLVGLDIATRKRANSPTHAVYLSGNGPLVKVLSEALARDELGRRRRSADKTSAPLVRQSIKAFIQNVHHFRDAGLRDGGPPPDRVVIFDEAQRAWNREMTSDFMRRKKGQPGFNESEPEFLLSYLDRHRGWAVVVCLVGGGQEINRGEAGISAWLHAIANRFQHWTAFISPNLTDSEYDAGHALRTLGTRGVVTDDNLHLAVSMRSFRAEHVSRFVKAVLDRDRPTAEDLFAQFRSRYPLVLTRDLARAKTWIRARARGSERFGLVASSGAQRLKPHAVDVRVEVNPVHWFLNDRDDTRSSFYMEDAATEFQVQGLELDWVCVTWDADLRFAGDDWTFHSFVGRRWLNVKQGMRRSYLRNAYRVLLTRARQGMVIFLPPGDAEDATRQPAFYDSTFEYLRRIGIPEL